MKSLAVNKINYNIIKYQYTYMNKYLKYKNIVSLLNLNSNYTNNSNIQIVGGALAAAGGGGPGGPGPGDNDVGNNDYNFSIDIEDIFLLIDQLISLGLEEIPFNPSWIIGDYIRDAHGGMQKLPPNALSSGYFTVPKARRSVNGIASYGDISYRGILLNFLDNQPVPLIHTLVLYARDNGFVFIINGTEYNLGIGVRLLQALIQAVNNAGVKLGNDDRIGVSILRTRQPDQNQFLLYRHNLTEPFFKQGSSFIFYIPPGPRSSISFIPIHGPRPAPQAPQAGQPEAGQPEAETASKSCCNMMGGQ